jgi:hypothetical protein
MKWEDIERQYFTEEEIKESHRIVDLVVSEIRKPKGRKRLAQRLLMESCRYGVGDE